MTPRFLQMDEVIAIHNDQITRYGGSAGVRDMGLLQSALAMPSASFGEQYLHADLHQMAAAYLYHITSNHPFIDGNKRVGAVAALVFLMLNGQKPTATEDQLEAMVMAVAKGQSGKDDVADFFREHTTQ